MCYTDLHAPFEPLDLINPMDGPKTTPRSPHWYFGPDWPGRRCKAKTRRGTPCQKPALTGKSRCQLHGGRGGAPSGKQNGRYKSGEWSKEAIREKNRIKHLVKLYWSITELD
jgi:hypothetical protein